jgi:hypothetical protein
MSRYTILVMVISMKKKRPYNLSLLRAQNTLPFFAVTNMFQGDMWIFAAPDPAVVGIDLITDMKRTFITESYRV